MKDVCPEALRAYFLWKDLDESLWQQFSRSMDWHHYPSGDEIQAAEQECLCVLWNGKIKVYAKGSSDTHTPLLRTMEAGALFGVNQIYSHGAPPMSRLVAARACDVLCIPAAVWEEILSKDTGVMQRYVRFLIQRIEFLNQKICYLTAGSTERKLATYLLSTLPADGSYAPLPLPAANLADLLDIGRASLYRAINKLSEDGFLVRQDKLYALLHREALQDHYS